MRNFLRHWLVNLALLAFGVGIGLFGDWLKMHKSVDDLRWSLKKAGAGDYHTYSNGDTKFVVNDKFRRR